MTATVHEIRHPLVQHKLTHMRDKQTPTKVFRSLAKEASFLLGYEMLKDLELTDKRIETPIEAIDAPVLSDRPLVFVSILRAGNGILSGLLELAPQANVGFVGVQRNEETLKPEHYYCNLPPELQDALIIVCDPMLATGGSAADSIDLIKKQGGTDIRMVTLLAAPEGVKAFHERHPDVDLYTASVDSHLNENGYIVPGLGDAGDRIFGTL